MQPAYPVPLSRMPAKIVLGGRGPGRAYCRQTLSIPGQDGIVGIKLRDNDASNIGGCAGIAEAKESP